METNVLNLVVAQTMDLLAMANSVCWYGHVLTKKMVMSYEGHWTLRSKVTEKREGEEDMEETGSGGKYEYLFEWERCSLPIKVDCMFYSDCHYVVDCLAVLSCRGYYRILHLVFPSHITYLLSAVCMLESGLSDVYMNMPGSFQEPIKKRSKLVLPSPQICDAELEEVSRLLMHTMVASCIILSSVSWRLMHVDA